jgi:hypothetical protein
VKEKLGVQQVTVTSRGMTDPDPVFDETMQVPWEVDDLRERLKAEVLPKVTAGARVDIEARVSEAPEFRRQLADEIRAQVRAAGAADATVRIRSAYKQGYSWMVEEVIPSLKGRGVKRVRIEVATLPVDLSKARSSTRCRRVGPELYRSTRSLRVNSGGVPGRNWSTPGETYRVEAFDANGRSLLKRVQPEDRQPWYSRSSWLGARDGHTGLSRQSRRRR